MSTRVRLYVMASSTLIARRINNGQSEIWLEDNLDTVRVVATNGIVYPVQTLCSQEESEAFHRAFSDGSAAVPANAAGKLMSDFKF